MINIEANNTNLFLLGRYSNNKPYKKLITDFKPYYFIEDKNGKYISIEGKKLKKIIVQHPSQVILERDKYEKTWESDITYVNRFLIDRCKKIEKEPLRIQYLDIETGKNDKNEFAKPENADGQILSICIFDSFLKKYFTFALFNEIYHGKKNVKEKQNNDVIYFFNDEKKMLNYFILFFNKTRPDIVWAWNGDNFDYPFIINRLKKLNLNFNKLSPISNVFFDNFKKKFLIKGISNLDMMLYYCHMFQKNKSIMMSLENASIEQQLEGKIKLNDSFDELYKNNLNEFLNYNKQDVKIMVNIDEKLGLTDYLDELRRISKSTFNELIFNSRIVDNFLIDFCNKKGVHVPRKNKKIKHEKIEGALVIKPKSGLHSRIAVGDIRSLYPTAIISCNMSPETLHFCDNKKNCNKKNMSCFIEKGICFSTEKKGLLPEVIQTLFNSRQELKKRFSETTNESEKKRLNLQQYTMKVLLNSFYGVLLYPKFRFYNREMGEAITFFGRKVNLWMQQKLNEKNYEIIAGDTDSIFFKLKNNLNNKKELINEAENVITYLNESFNVFAKEMNISNQSLVLELEKIYSSLILVDAKKRYAGKRIFPNENYHFVGFEMIRSDTSKFCKNFQKKLFKLILNFEEKNNIISFIKKEIKKIKNGEYKPEDLAFSVGINKNLYTGYKNIPIYVRAAIFSNKYLNEKIQQGDKIKYIYISQNSLNLPKENVIGFKKKFPTGFKIDNDLIIEKNIFNKVEKVFKALNWDLNEIKNQSNLNKWM